MVENLSGFVFEIVRLAADLATVITLLFIVLPFVKTIKTEQANGLKNAYESQSKQRWTVINNPQNADYCRRSLRHISRAVYKGYNSLRSDQ